MSNKRIRVSIDSGTSYYTLPGNQGDLDVQLNNTNDTVFGQAFESMNPNLGQWAVTANGLYKGVAGYNAVMKKPGTPTTMTAEACSLVSGKTYQITNTIKRVISYVDALTVLDNGVDRTANVLSIDYLSGQVTFLPAYTVVGPVTVTGKYIPLVIMAKARGFTLTQTQTEVDQTAYEDAQSNSGMRVYVGGLKTISLQVDHIFAASNAWITSLLTRGIIYVEVDLDAGNPGTSVFRGFFKNHDDKQSGNQGAVETEQVQLSLYVPDGALVVQPFGWYFNGSKLNQALINCINTFSNQGSLLVQYLPTGNTGDSPVSGQVGSAIVTTCTLTNAIDGLNSFNLSFRGTGALTGV